MGQFQPWLIYALGGGWGHLNRAIALGRLAAAQTPVHILTNSPYAAQVHKELGRWQQRGQSVPTLLILPSTLKKAALCRQVQAQILSNPYHCLIVDTFPRGLGGELADLLPQMNCPKIFIHRDINPDYVRSHRLSEFVARHYDQIIVPGEESAPLASLPQATHTSPWLIYDAAELTDVLSHSVAGACPFLHSSTESPLILVCAAGNACEQSFFGALTTRLQRAFPYANVRCLSARCPPGCSLNLWLQVWPGLPQIAQATVVVGSGGYNTVYECAALQKPLVAFAWNRLYDRQAQRLNSYGVQVSTTLEAIEQVGASLQLPQKMSWGSCRYPIAPYPNGAADAFQKIQQLLEGAIQ
ncbi:MAG TPA: hypothetical protein V6D29_21080 [Leptolyngbyaceae cyanobacterium]